MTPTQILAGIGAVVVLGSLFRLLNFIWIYCLRPSSVGRYIYGPAPYALVTGASDGIGKAVAQELYDNGFNLILHGRSEDKTRKVAEEIKATSTSTVTRDVQYFLAAADSPDVDFEGIASKYKDLNITLVFNNVGGGRMTPNKIDTCSEEVLLGDIRVNALFSFYLTRALLPKLRATGGPSLVCFVGSQSSGIRIPRRFTYAPSKAFLWQLTRCLNSDERYWTPTNVSFMYLDVGTVITNSLRATPTIFYPTAQRFAKAVVAKLGCGKEKIIPYMPHAIQLWFMGFLGDAIIEIYAAEAMKGILADEAKRG